MLSPKSVVPFHEPLPVTTKMLPFASAAMPPPLIHTPFARPFAEGLKTPSWASVAAAYDMTHPCQGSTSQCEDHAITTWPLSNSNAAR